MMPFLSEVVIRERHERMLREVEFARQHRLLGGHIRNPNRPRGLPMFSRSKR
jgi:hypothetical protein